MVEKKYLLASTLKIQNLIQLLEFFYFLLFILFIKEFIL